MASGTATKRARRTTTSTRPRSPELGLPVSTWRRPSRRNGLTVTDIFCGAGGSSLGLTHAGFELVYAANHWQRAIETHGANFGAYAEHICADVNNYDFRKWRGTNVLWASPICTEMSPAGGNGGKKKPKKAQVDGQASIDDVEELGHVEEEGYVRTRATFYDVIRYAEVHMPDAIIVENVPDVAEKWKRFGWWLGGLTMFGYNAQLASWNTAHIGGPGNEHAGQWRDRLYIVFTKVGIPLPDMELRPLSWCANCEENVRGVQTWCAAARGRATKVGRYRRDPNSTYGQYWYTCPNSRCREGRGGEAMRVEPWVKPAAAHIDWSDLGEPIHTRKGDDKLKPNTLARIEAGLVKFGRPFVATARTSTNPVVSDLAHPLRAVTTGNNHAVINPQAYTVNSNHDDDRIRSVRGEPFHAMTTKIGDGLVLPPGAFIVKNYGGNATPDNMATSMGHPMGALTTKGQQALTVPPGVDSPFVFSPGGAWDRAMIDPTAGPLHTQLANEKGFESICVPESFMTVLRRNADAESLQDPMQTVATGSGHGGGHQYLTTPPDGSFYTMSYTAEPGREERMCRSMYDALGAQTASNSHALVVPYQKGDAKSSREPFSTMMANDTFGLVRPDGYVAQVSLAELVQACRYRMLKPEESAAAQRFDPDYLITGNLGERTMQAGNAVSANAAQEIGERVAKVLCEVGIG